MGEVVLVRHGETTWSASGQHTSHTDLPLTEAGVAAGEAVRRRFAGRFPGAGPALVLSSPRRRAYDTAVLAGFPADRIEVTDDLREWEYGEYEGLTTARIRENRPDWSLWRDSAPGGETAEQVGVRVDRLISRVRGVEGDVVLFAHGHVLRVLGARWIELAPTEGARLALSTASVSVLGYEHAIPVLDLWNDVSHLHAPTPTSIDVGAPEPATRH